MTKAAQIKSPVVVDPERSCVLNADAIPGILMRLRDTKPNETYLDWSLHGPTFGPNCLTKSAKSALIPELAVLLKDSNPDIRQYTISAFGQLTIEDRSMLHSRNPVIIEGAVKFIVPLLENSKRDIRNSAASALGVMELDDLAKGMIPELLIQLKNVNPNIRAGAADVLVNMGVSGRSAIPKLITMLKDPVPRVRISVIYSLGSIGASMPETIDLLNDIIQNDPDPDVRKAALEKSDYLYFIDHERIRGL